MDAPTTALLPPVVDTVPPAEMITVPAESLAQPNEAASIPSADPADAHLPAPITATPTSEPIQISPGTTLEVASIPDSSASDPTPIAPMEAATTLEAQAKEPGRLVFPSIGLDAPVVPAKMRTIIFRGERYQQWLAPNYHAAGWHTDSALLGAVGNTVLNGHHNSLGAVSGRLVELEAGDIIQVYSHNSLFTYQVTNRMIVPEKYQQMDTRMANCGAPGCHDGKAVFGHDQQNCQRCHAGTRAADRKTASVLAPLPKDRFGNGVNWVTALEKGTIRTATHLTLPQADLCFDSKLLLEAEWRNIPPAVFPHRSHVAWLDCNNCHPDIFNIKKKTTKHFAMVRILKGEFCGVCHLTVAFPMDDCKRCHPKR